MSQRAAVDAYVLEVEQVAAQLRSFAYRAQAPGLVGGDGIASAAESQSWTQKRFRVSNARVWVVLGWGGGGLAWLGEV